MEDVFCFPDPHFGLQLTKPELSPPRCCRSSAYVLREEGVLCTITDVEGLHMDGEAFDDHPPSSDTKNGKKMTNVHYVMGLPKRAKRWQETKVVNCCMFEESPTQRNK